VLAALPVLKVLFVTVNSSMALKARRKLDGAPKLAPEPEPICTLLPCTLTSLSGTPKPSPMAL